MIIEELGKFVIIDEIRHNATASELYFLSCLLGNEMLSLSEDWPGRIYTSQFIYDILLKKKPRVHAKCFRVLKANTPIKFKSKNKTIWVTMFESEEIKNSVMIHFDDSINTYLYSRAFNEISSCFNNEYFMECVKKGIDYVYIDTMLCNSNPYICTEDIIDEIKTINLKHPDSKLVVIIPNFGYEKLLVELVKAFPQTVYPTNTQRYMLKILGYSEYLSMNKNACRIIIYLPGISSECLETDLIIIYITVGDACTLNNEYGVYLRQWSPLPSLMDQQVLLEMIRPKHIIPIKENDFQNTVDLPFSLRSLAEKPSNEIIEPDSTDTESWQGDYSNGSIETKSSAGTEVEFIELIDSTVSMPSTKMFCPQAQSSQIPIVEIPTQEEEKNRVPICDKANYNTKLQIPIEITNLTKPRIRRNQRTDLTYSDSDDDFVY